MVSNRTHTTQKKYIKQLLHKENNNTDNTHYTHNKQNTKHRQNTQKT